MKSYNCFYSALYELLEPYYRNLTPLLLHNRWQFFYKPGTNYSDDKRFVGEHPMLFDQFHIESLRRDLKITIRMQTNADGFQKVRDTISAQGFALIFANKCCFHPPPAAAGRGRCVTTVKIRSAHKGVICDLYDPDVQPSRLLPMDDVIPAWENASDYPFLNRCMIDVNVKDGVQDEAAVRSLVYRNIARSAADYLYGGGMNNGCFYGGRALYMMADDIVNWDYEKFSNGAMYIQSVKKQRSCFMQLITGGFNHTHNAALQSRLAGIVDMWDKLRILLYLVAKRRQLNAVQHVRELIKEIAAAEIAFVSDVLGPIQHRYVRNTLP